MSDDSLEGFRQKNKNLVCVVTGGLRKFKLMLKWPNLYYSTSAFAPKYYPETIIKYANPRGADKVI